ncbi:MAG: hypothetical protein ABMA00_15220 [Gemmatimonas sp.]
MIRWTIAIALGLLVAWIAYARAATPGQRGRVVLLAMLRAVAVLLVAALFLGAPASPPRAAAPLLAIDASASWRRAGGDDSTTVRELRGQWQAIAREQRIADAVVLVGDSLRDVSVVDITQLVPADAASRVRSAVDRAAALGRPMLLLTDGEVDDAESLADAPLGSQVRVLARTPRRDAALADLTVPASASAGDTLQVAALLASGAAGSTEGSMRITLDGVEAGRAAVPALAAFATTRITLPLPLPRGARTRSAR